MAASLYIGDLHSDVTEAMLYDVFNSVGPVGSIRVYRNSITRKSLGYAYVNFSNTKDAEHAREQLNYSTIKGRCCRIMWCQRDPSQRKNATGNIFVKNLDTTIDNKALYDTFSIFGNIVSCKVSCDHTGKSLGYGFVHFESDDTARQAIEKTNGMQIGANQVTVLLSEKPEKKKGEKEYTNLYVKSFPQDWDEAKLVEYFKDCGSITASCLRKDKQDRPFAFVAFATYEEAKKAVEEKHKADVRTDEQKAAKEGENETDGPEEHPAHLLYVQRAQTKEERAKELKLKNAKTEKTEQPKGVNLYVKNLDESMDDTALKELFEPFGAITSACAVKDDSGTKCKGFGFVGYGKAEDATRAVTELHLKVIKGKPLYVGLAEKREDRAERLRRGRYSAGKDAGKDFGGKAKGKGGNGKDGGKDFGGWNRGHGAPQQDSGPGGWNESQGYGGFQGQGYGGMQGQAFGGGFGFKGQTAMRPQAPQAFSGMHGMMPMQGKGAMSMMNPQMMAMMQQKGGMPMMNPQMMAMMQQKGGMPMPGMPGMPMGMPGMNPQMMAMMQQKGGPPMGGGMPQAQLPRPVGGPLTAASLAAAPPAMQKQMLGQKLFPMVAKTQPELAGKITGMILEMDSSELLMLLESEPHLNAKIDEAVHVLQGRR